MKLFRKTIVGPANNPLIVRYVLIRFDSWGIYLHHLMRSDYDRAFHDHPWPFTSIILTGSYIEHTPQEAKLYNRFSVLCRPARWLHRLEMEKPMWTLILVGRRERRWGFMLPTGWCWWRKHNSQLNICEEEVIHTNGKD